MANPLNDNKTSFSVPHRWGGQNLIDITSDPTPPPAGKINHITVRILYQSPLTRLKSFFSNIFARIVNSSKKPKIQHDVVIERKYSNIPSNQLEDIKTQIKKDLETTLAERNKPAGISDTLSIETSIIENALTAEEAKILTELKRLNRIELEKLNPKSPTQSPVPPLQSPPPATPSVMPNISNAQIAQEEEPNIASIAAPSQQPQQPQEEVLPEEEEEAALPDLPSQEPQVSIPSSIPLFIPPSPPSIERDELISPRNLVGPSDMEAISLQADQSLPPASRESISEGPNDLVQERQAQERQALEQQQSQINTIGKIASSVTSTLLSSSSSSITSSSSNQISPTPAIEPLAAPSLLPESFSSHAEQEPIAEVAELENQIADQIPSMEAELKGEPISDIPVDQMLASGDIYNQSVQFADLEKILKSHMATIKPLYNAKIKEADKALLNEAKALSGKKKIQSKMTPALMNKLCFEQRLTALENRIKALNALGEKIKANPLDAKEELNTIQGDIYSDIDTDYFLTDLLTYEPTRRETIKRSVQSLVNTPAPERNASFANATMFTINQISNSAIQLKNLMKLNDQSSQEIPKLCKEITTNQNLTLDQVDQKIKELMKILMDAAKERAQAPDIEEIYKSCWRLEGLIQSLQVLKDSRNEACKIDLAQIDNIKDKVIVPISLNLLDNDIKGEKQPKTDKALFLNDFLSQIIEKSLWNNTTTIEEIQRDWPNQFEFINQTYNNIKTSGIKASAPQASLENVNPPLINPLLVEADSPLIEADSILEDLITSGFSIKTQKVVTEWQKKNDPRLQKEISPKKIDEGSLQESFNTLKESIRDLCQKEIKEDLNKNRALIKALWLDPPKSAQDLSKAHPKGASTLSSKKIPNTLTLALQNPNFRKTRYQAWIDLEKENNPTLEGLIQQKRQINQTVATAKNLQHLLYPTTYWEWLHKGIENKTGSFLNHKFTKLVSVIFANTIVNPDAIRNLPPVRAIGLVAPQLASQSTSNATSDSGFNTLFMTSALAYSGITLVSNIYDKYYRSVDYKASFTNAVTYTLDQISSAAYNALDCGRYESLEEYFKLKKQCDSLFTNNKITLSELYSKVSTLVQEMKKIAIDIDSLESQERLIKACIQLEAQVGSLKLLINSHNQTRKEALKKSVNIRHSKKTFKPILRSLIQSTLFHDDMTLAAIKSDAKVWSAKENELKIIFENLQSLAEKHNEFTTAASNISILDSESYAFEIKGQAKREIEDSDEDDDDLLSKGSDSESIITIIKAKQKNAVMALKTKQDEAISALAGNINTLKASNLKELKEFQKKVTGLVSSIDSSLSTIKDIETLPNQMHKEIQQYKNELNVIETEINQLSKHSNQTSFKPLIELIIKHKDTISDFYSTINRQLESNDITGLKKYRTALKTDIYEMRKALKKYDNISQGINDHKDLLIQYGNAENAIQKLKSASPPQLIYAKRLQQKLNNAKSNKPVGDLITSIRNASDNLKKEIDTYIENNEIKSPMSVERQLEIHEKSAAAAIDKLSKEDVELLRNTLVEDVHSDIDQCTLQLETCLKNININIKKYISEKYYEEIRVLITGEINKLEDSKYYSQEKGLQKTLLENVKILENVIGKRPVSKERINFDKLTIEDLKKYKTKIEGLIGSAKATLQTFQNVDVEYTHLFETIGNAKTLADTINKNGFSTEARTINRICTVTEEDLSKNKKNITDAASMRTLSATFKAASNSIENQLDEKRYKELEHATNSLINQIEGLPNDKIAFDSEEAKVIREKIAREFTEQINNQFIVALNNQQAQLTQLRDQRHLDPVWYKDLVAKLENSRTEILEFRDGKKRFKGLKVLPSLTETRPLTQLSKEELRKYFEAIKRITSIEIMFGPASDLKAFQRSFNGLQEALKNTYFFLNNGLTKSMLENEICIEGMKNLSVIFEQIKSMSSLMTKNISSQREMQECIAFLNNANNSLNKAINNIKADKPEPVELGVWGQMKVIESENPDLTTSNRYGTDNVTFKMSQHMALRNELLTGIHPTSKKRAEIALTAAARAVANGNQYNLEIIGVVNEGIDFVETAIERAYGSSQPKKYPFQQIDNTTIIGNAALEFLLKLNPQPNKAQIIATVAMIAGNLAYKQPRGGDQRQKHVAAAKAAGKGTYAAIYQYTYNLLIDPANVENRASIIKEAKAEALLATGLGAAFYLFQAMPNLYGNDTSRAGQLAGNIAKAAVTEHNPNIDTVSLVKIAGMAASWAACTVQARISHDSRALRLAAETAAMEIGKTFRTADVNKNNKIEAATIEAAAVASGAVIAADQRANPITETAAQIATIATVSAINRIPVPASQPQLPDPVHDNILDVARDAARNAEIAAPNDREGINKAAVEAAVKAAAPINISIPAFIGSISGNLIAIKNILRNYHLHISALIDQYESHDTYAAALKKYNEDLKEYNKETQKWLQPVSYVPPILPTPPTAPILPRPYDASLQKQMLELKAFIEKYSNKINEHLDLAINLKNSQELAHYTKKCIQDCYFMFDKVNELIKKINKNKLGTPPAILPPVAHPVVGPAVPFGALPAPIVPPAPIAPTPPLITIVPLPDDITWNLID